MTEPNNIPTSPERIFEDVSLALMEDLGGTDIRKDISAFTLKDILPDNVEANLKSNSDGILCGTAWFNQVFALLDENNSSKTTINWQFREGDEIKNGDILCELAGNPALLLAGERTALNFLQILSGIATRSKNIADIVARYCRGMNEEYPAPQVLDTRKTIPGIRAGQKYAVRIGGCSNHRSSLRDVVMIKENHILAGGGLANVLRNLSLTNTNDNSAPSPQTIIEVENLAELEELLRLILEHKYKVDIILLDNFAIKDVGGALALRKDYADKGLSPLPLYELSGSITSANLEQLLPQVRGVERISMGYLAKDFDALDFSLRFS